MRQKLTKMTIRKASSAEGKTLFIRDTDQLGFGLRVTPKGAKSFVFEYSLPGWRSPRRMTLGRVGDLTLDQARVKARQLREKVAGGIDPLEEREAESRQPTVRDLANRFLAEHAASKSASTQRNYRLLWQQHLLPALGRRKVAQVTWSDISAIHRRMNKTPYMANRMLAVASKSFNLAMKWGWWPREIPNPAQGHDRYSEDSRRGQALTPEQLGAVGQALAQEAADSIPAACLKTVLLTGARPGEILKARWENLEMDDRVLRLPVTKTGPRAVYLGRPAADIVAAQARQSDYLFPGRMSNQPMYDLKAIWRRIKERAELPERMRLYDATRHTFITTALELGLGLDRVKALAGHSVSSDITARYTHYRADRLLEDADWVAVSLDESLVGSHTQS